MAFARSQMEDKGWVTREGLGRHVWCKFDQAGVGHNRSRIGLIFCVKVEDNEVIEDVQRILFVNSKFQGEVRVDFNSNKSELSTKKMRKKAQNEIKNKLFSNFFKSGTSMWAKMEEKNHEENFVKDKDLSKLKELTDEELDADCGGRTAHKGSRYGHKMTAKLDRIDEAEREYMENYNKKMQESKVVPVDKLKKKKKSKHVVEDLDADKVEDASDRLGSCDEVLPETKSKKNKKNKKNKRSLEVPDSVEDEATEPLKKKKKRKKEKPDEDLEDQLHTKKIIEEVQIIY